jgi:hypothetical protein
MPAFDEADLDAFLDEFGIDVQVQRSGVPLDPIRGIFRRNTEFIGQSGEILVLPSIKVKTSALDGLHRSDDFVIKGQWYRMYGHPEPRNSGFSLVGLVQQ